MIEPEQHLEPLDEYPTEEQLAPRPTHHRDSARARFLEEVGEVRARLHRYCSGMLGSVLDGEDVVQDTLAAAFFRLKHDDSDERPLAPLLFRIAHNRCIDRIRRRRFEAPMPQGKMLDEPLAPEALAEHPGIEFEIRQESALALQTLLHVLPPKERSCLVLRDALELSLGEIAQVTGSSEGSVKSALHRARAKLDGAQPITESPSAGRPAADVLARYLECFNRRDWAGIAELLHDDVRVDVVEEAEDAGSDLLLTRYSKNYEALDGGWRLTLGTVDGELVLLIVRGRGCGERAAWPIRVEVSAGKISALRDYVVCGVLAECEVRTCA